MKGQPCKSCLPGRPNHKRQRVVVRDGQRVQVCQACNVTIGFLPPLTNEETADLIVETLREIDSTSGTEPINPADYDPELVLEKLHKAWGARTSTHQPPSK